MQRARAIGLLAAPSPASCLRAWTSLIPISQPGCRRSPAKKMTDSGRGLAHDGGRPLPSKGSGNG